MARQVLQLREAFGIGACLAQVLLVQYGKAEIVGPGRMAHGEIPLGITTIALPFLLRPGNGEGPSCTKAGNRFCGRIR